MRHGALAGLAPLKHRNSRDARGPGGQTLGRILGGDTAEREDGDLHGPNSFAETFETLRRAVASFRRGGKDGAEDREIGAPGLRGAKVFDGMRGDADYEARGYDGAQRGGGNRLGRQVDAMSARGQGDVHTRIHQDSRGVWVGQGQRAADQVEIRPRGKIFFANLNVLDAVFQRPCEKLQKAFDAAGGMTIGDVIPRVAQWRVWWPEASQRPTIKSTRLGQAPVGISSVRNRATYSGFLRPMPAKARK